MKLQKIKTALFILPIVASLFFSVAIMGYTGTATAATVATCNDRVTVIPSTFRGDASVFCKDHGGHSGLTMPACEDKTTVIPVGFRGDVTDYCVTHGGFTLPAGSNSGTISAGEPNYVKNDCNGPDNKAGESEDSENHCGILDYLILFINVLSALVGVVVVGSIIYGGIQYSMAGGDPQKVAGAKKRILNAVVALFFFIFTYAILQYLVPGGIF